MNITHKSISRRRFVIGAATTGLGLSLGMSLPLHRQAHAATTDDETELNAWVVIAPDDTVTIRIARSEMGQGTLTGLAQLVAEELECDWDKVTWEYPTPGENLKRDRIWRDFATGGSRGIRTSHDYVREGGALARELLIAAAASTWSVPASECRAAQSVIYHDASGRKLRFGDVASAAASMQPPENITLKDPADWKLIGQPVKRLDTRDKLTGKQLYGSDLVLPGMLNAAIRACPVHGGTRKSFDDSRAKSMPGVAKVVAVGDNAVAVVAKTWWQAKTALEAVSIEWDLGEGASVSSADIENTLKEGLSAQTPFVGNKVGDFDAAIKQSAKTFTADYGYPFQNHATMEPMNATALWTEDKCEVWCPTQNGEAALAAAIEASGHDADKVDVYKQLLGGGFGRRGQSDFVTQAIQIAKTMPGTPIKLLWSREEDMLQGFFHPVTQARLTAGLTENGDLEALHVRISGQSILYGLMPERLGGKMDPVQFQILSAEGDHAISYSVPNLLVDHAMRNPHVRPGFWRGVNANQNAVYLESFIDELAHETGQDPLAFRRKLMVNHPKALAVLDKVAENAGWGKKLAPGRGLGLAVCYSFGSYVAACADVSVVDGALKMHHIYAATDPGYAVNPQQIEAQVSGSFVYGLSAMLYGKCTVKDGAIEQTNFDTFPSMKMAEMPDVSVEVMPSGGFWGGVGEPTIAVAAPAVLNAIYAASGRRIRQLPLKDHELG